MKEKRPESATTVKLNTENVNFEKNVIRSGMKTMRRMLKTFRVAKI